MWSSLKEKLLWLLGGAVAMALAFWHLTRRRSPAKPIHVEPKKVPESDEEVIAEAVKEGIIKP